MEPSPKGYSPQPWEIQAGRGRGQSVGRGRGAPNASRGKSFPRGSPLARCTVSNSSISTATSGAARSGLDSAASTPVGSRDRNENGQRPSQQTTDTGSRISIAPYTYRDETGGTYFEDYQSVTFHAPWDDYSFEELRLNDYLGRKNEVSSAPAVETIIARAVASERHGHAFGEEASRRPSHKLLKGQTIEVVVGSEHDSWHLPRALVSHHSRRLEKACDPDQKDFQTTLILPEDDADGFVLFVEWLYHGNYILDNFALTTRRPDVNLDAQAWVLGDHLQCIDFKDYAMERLYTQYISGATTGAITISDIRYAFTQSAADSKLQLLYKHLLASRFSQRDKVEGTALDWDDVLQEHPQLRRFIMEKAMHGGPARQDLIQLRPYYKEVEGPEIQKETSATNNIVTPAKRNADGETVKSELMDICNVDLRDNV